MAPSPALGTALSWADQASFDCWSEQVAGGSETVMTIEDFMQPGDPAPVVRRPDRLVPRLRQAR